MLLPEGRMIFNIPIRTIEYRNQSAIYGVGAGITIDSILKMKFKNFTTKLKSWRICKMQLFETMKLEDGCIYRSLSFKRITESSKELKFNFDQQQWYELTQMIKTTYPNGKYRLKLTLEQNGQLNYVLAPLADKTFFTAKWFKDLI